MKITDSKGNTIEYEVQQGLKFTDDEKKKLLEPFEKNGDLYYYPKRLRRVRKVGRAFNFAIGQRGDGKTMGALVYEALEAGRIFLYLRRTQTEMDAILNDKTTDGRMNPFKRINKMSGLDINFRKINKALAGIYCGNDIFVGFAGALSTFANIRSLEAGEIKAFVYDEFIPEKHKAKIRNEADAFFNLYETINRNRELEGEPPVYAYLLSNANSIASPILYETGLIPRIQKMVERGQTFADFGDMDCIVELLEDRQLREKKSQTALYKFTKGTKFANMALNNEFAYDDMSALANRDVREYNPICTYDRYGIWKHKSENLWYCCKVCDKTVKHFECTDVGRKQFWNYIGGALAIFLVENKLEFVDYETKYFITDSIF